MSDAEFNDPGFFIFDSVELLWLKDCGLANNCQAELYRYPIKFIGPRTLEENKSVLTSCTLVRKVDGQLCKYKCEILTTVKPNSKMIPYQFKERSPKPEKVSASSPEWIAWEKFEKDIYDNHIKGNED